MLTDLSDDLIALRPLSLDDVDEWLAGEDAEQIRWFEFPGPATREHVEAAITAWVKLDGAVAEARLFPLTRFIGDVYAGALLTEQAAWERATRQTDRKDLVARLYAARYLADQGPLRGIDVESDDAIERFDELLDGALVIGR